MAPVRERIAAVFAAGHQGSGYLVAPRLILTAAHVVRDAATVRVALPGSPHDATCRVVWSGASADVDAALLLAEDDTWPAGGPPVEPVAWGTVRTLDPLPGCQAIGFPYARRGPGGVLESEQLIGTVKPGSSLIGGLLVLDNAFSAPAARQDGRSPWAGFSGSALFHGDVLLGVVRADPHGWRHGRVEATPAERVFGRPEARRVLAEAGVELPAPTEASGAPPDPDAVFEREYTARLAERYGTLSIFGLDLRDRSAANWPLDDAYLSLEATVPDAAGPGADAYPRSALPADQALAGRRRVLLRGVAGSGKTTLVQWLAVGAARQELPDELGHLRGRVPFVLPLRTLIRLGRLPVPEDFLAATGNPLSGNQPAGWAGRVLARGRGLVTIDGMDEVGERERDLVQDWLRDLLPLHPDNMWLVTSRPSAVEDGWLTHEGFTELTLSPMSHDDITSFVDRWHHAAAARVTDPSEAERLAGHHESLLTAIRTKHDLAGLATNPLMCGMICALHRDRDGFLPRGRKELYETALNTLIADRDQRRRLGSLEGIELPAEAQIQLLQRLAYWLIRNGHSELDQDLAERLIADALPAIPSAAAQGEAPAVLRYLLLRGGLIREPAEGSVDFIHRTFQDYLGAKRAIEERDFGLLVDKAPDGQWEDVIRMAVAHARPQERAEILSGLLGRDNATDAERARVSLLAMACLELATELDPRVREAVQSRALEFIPPRDLEQARALADIGTIVLELLPGPEGCPDEPATVATVVTASLIGTDAAVPLLRRFRSHPSLPVRSQLAWNWNRFDDERYFAEVLGHVRPDNLIHVAWSPNQLRMLRAAGRSAELDLRGDFTAEQLRAHLDPERLIALSLVGNGTLSGLDVLRHFPRLRTLALRRCSALEDCTALRDLPLRGLLLSPPPDHPFPAVSLLPESLRVLHMRHAGDLTAAPGGRADQVRVLTLDDLSPSAADLRWVAGCFPELRELHLGCPAGSGPVPLAPLAAVSSLRTVEIRDADPADHEALLAAGVRVRRLGAPQARP